MVRSKPSGMGESSVYRAVSVNVSFLHIQFLHELSTWTWSMHQVHKERWTGAIAPVSSL